MSTEASLRVLLVDENRGRSAILEQALTDSGYRVIAIVQNGEDLSRQVSSLQPDAIIMDIETPSRDMLAQMESISRDNPKPVVVFSDDDESHSIKRAIEAGVSAYVVDGLSASRIRPLLDVAITRFREYQALKAELTEARTSLQERKLIDRAKGLIMKQKQCDEETAYQALRKTAMSSNQRIVDVARNLLISMELLG